MEDVLELPEDLDFDDLLEFFVEQLGEPEDTAYADVDGLGRIDVGWVFAVPEGFDVAVDRADHELVVVLLVEDDDNPGELVAAGVDMARLRADIVDLVHPDVIVLPE